MIFRARTDIPAPPSHVLDCLSDMSRLRSLVDPESRILKHAEGGNWSIEGTFFGVPVSAPLTVLLNDGADGVTYRIRQSAVVATADTHVRPEGAASLLDLSLHFAPESLKGRVMIKTLTVARPTIEPKLQGAVDRLGRVIAEAYAPSA